MRRPIETVCKSFLVLVIPLLSAASFASTTYRLRAVPTTYTDIPPAGLYEYEVVDGHILLAARVCVHHVVNDHVTYAFVPVEGEYTIPNVVGGYYGVFEDERYLTFSIDAVQGSTGSSAFDKLTKVTVSEGIQVLDRAFNSCKDLVEVALPDSLRSMNGAFSGCAALRSIVLPEGVVDIGQSSFSGCTSLRFAQLPFALGEIGANSFRGCENLSDVVFPSLCKVIGNRAFDGCASLSRIDLGSCELVGQSAFSGCVALKTIDVPDSVTNIEMSAFYSCTSLKAVKYGRGLKEIGNSAFQGCTALTEIILQDGVERLGEYAFKDCTGAGRLRIPTSLISFQPDTFSYVAPGELLTGQYCSLMSNSSVTNLIILPGWTEYAPNSRYRGGSFKRIELPETVESIGSMAFYGNTSLSEVVLKGRVGSVGDKAFYGCTSLISLPDFGVALTNLGAEAFRNCTGLKDVRVAGSVCEIPSKTFYNCTGIERVVLEEGVSSIAYDAFFYDYAIKTLSLPSTAMDLRTSTSYSQFPRVNGVATFHQKEPPANLKKTFLTEFSGVIYYPPEGEAAWQTFLAEAGLSAYGKSWSDALESDPGSVEVEDVPVPYGWLAKYGLTDTRSPEAAAVMPTGKVGSDGQGLVVWHDFVAGTDPTNPNDTFKASITFDNETGKPVISWTPELSEAETAKREYKVFGKAKINDKDWTLVDGDAENFNFFKVSVGMKP